MDIDVLADKLLDLYGRGLFPMADSVDSPEVYMVEPEYRGLLSISDLHISKSLLKTLKKSPYEIRIDNDFTAVIDACAETTHDRPSSWINPVIRALFIHLHNSGHAHSVECCHDGELIGGLYGVKIGGVFCGESMFSRRSNASKIALVHLCARLWKAGFKILDCQFINDHLKQFGCYEIPNDEYLNLLQGVIELSPDFLLKTFEGSETDLLHEYLSHRHDNLTYVME